MSALPLDTFRAVIGYNPWHFWGWENRLVPVTSACNGLLREYDWQDADATSRSEIRDAIDTAEMRLKEYLGYGVAPQYSNKTLSYPHYYQKDLWRISNTDSTGRWVSVALGEGYVQALGVETLSIINAAAVVGYTDNDGDGLLETFTVSVATSVTDPTQIAVYFTATDRLDDEEVGPRWRIEPVSVSISAGIATIRGKSWMLARPILYEGVATTVLDPSVAGNYVTALAVYRRYTNPDGDTADTSQGLLTWESYPYPAWAYSCPCGGTTSQTDPAAIAQAIARVGIRNADLGFVIPGQSVLNDGVWAASSWASCKPPDRVTIRYLAGWPFENGKIARKWKNIVTWFAAAEISARLCTDNTSSHVLHRWQFDHALAAGANDERYNTSQEDLENPFGTREGHIQAWHRVKNERILQGVLP